ncbi:UHRF1 binding protein 1-like, partial [Cichlidogyrus casuarinus]
MANLLKNQIIKPLSKFAKNLNTNKLKLNTLKGEIDLYNLELDEEVLMEVLDLPTWLVLRKAICNKVSVKIQWTKLKVQPICVSLDCVYVEVEALSEPRPISTLTVGSYRYATSLFLHLARTSSGKYGFVDKVIDSIRLDVNIVQVIFIAPAFKASIELNRVVVASKTPLWKDGDLSHTSIASSDKNSILLFKEISWDFTRFEASGLLEELDVTPVKLITNLARVRVVFKKCLSDSSLISTRLQFLFDELLWILTVSQLEAVSIFAQSLEKSIQKSAEQSKRHAEERTRRQQETAKPTQNTPQKHSHQQTKQQDQAPQTKAQDIFAYFDVPETSYHMQITRIKLHFCEDSKSSNSLFVLCHSTNVDFPLSANAIADGSIRITLHDLSYDFHPFHVAGAPRQKWRSEHQDFLDSRDDWLRSLQDYHEKYLQALRKSGPSSNCLLMESVSQLHVLDASISCIDYPGRIKYKCPLLADMKRRCAKPGKPT